jgi:hypothetical protein
MQYPGTSSAGMFGGGAGALAAQLSPTNLAARRQALIARLAQGQAGRTAFPGSGAGGGFAGSLLNPFADAMSGGGQIDGNQFYGPSGVGSPAYAANTNFADRHAISGTPVPYTGPPITSDPPPTTDNPLDGIRGAFNPTASINPSWASIIPSLAHIVAGNTFKAY